MSGETEAERDEGSETDSKTARRRYRQTDIHVHARAHTHTHTGRQRQREGDTERVTERQQTGDRQGREDGIGSETDTLAQPERHLRGRPHTRSRFPKGGGISLGPGPGWTRCPGAGSHPWGPQDFLEAEVSKVPFSLAT